MTIINAINQYKNDLISLNELNAIVNKYGVIVVEICGEIKIIA